MANKVEYGNNMLIHTAYWGKHDTFKMLPINKECPFTEVIYDRAHTLLVVISKISKENYQMVPTLDDDGEPIKAKKPKSNGKGHKEQRVKMNVLQEHYIVEKDEQVAFIKQFAVNHETYNYDRWLRDLEDEKDALVKPEAAPILGGDGLPTGSASKKK